MTQFRSTKRRKNDRQFIWDYMRRNRVFKIEDLLTIVEEMSMESMKVFFKQLEHAGFVKVRIPAKLFRERTYGFVKNTGALCPVWVKKQKRLYDRNTQEMQIKDASMKLPIEVKRKGKLKPVDPMEYDKGRIFQVLKAEPDGLDVLSLLNRCGIGPTRFHFVLKAMKREGEVTETDHSMLKLKEKRNAG